MRVDAFDFDLPDDRIALRPETPRDAARLLVVDPPDRFQDFRVADLPDLLQAGDLLVFNDTKVIGAALAGRRLGRGVEPPISILLLERVDASRWKALAKPGRRLKVDDRIRFGDGGRVCLLGTLDALVEAKGEAGEVTLAFEVSGPVLDEFIAAIGDMPLPPYIAARRAARRSGPHRLPDAVRARGGGGCGSHRRPAFYAGAHAEARGARHRPRDRHASCRSRDLHAGPVRRYRKPCDASRTRASHAQMWQIGVNAARAAGGRVVAVGTTSLRLLESSAGPSRTVDPYEGETRIFITPGYRFRTVDALVTNFHLPRSTLFMLVAAFSGLDTMKRAYAHAIDRGYRFYSYGDASLLFPGRI